MKSLTSNQDTDAAKGGVTASGARASATPELSSIADVMEWTRRRLAEIAGVRVEAAQTRSENRILSGGEAQMSKWNWIWPHVGATPIRKGSTAKCPPD